MHRKLAKASNIRVINKVWNTPSYAPHDRPIFACKDQRVYLSGVLSTRLVLNLNLA